MRIFLGFIKYVIVVPIFFLIMSGTAIAASGCMGYFLLLCFSEGSESLFWLGFLTLSCLIFFAVILTIVLIHKPKNNRRRVQKRYQPMASSGNNPNQLRIRGGHN